MELVAMCMKAAYAMYDEGAENNENAGRWLTVRGHCQVATK